MNTRDIMPKAPPRPEMPNKEWKQVDLDSITEGDIVYTDSTHSYVHFGRITSISRLDDGATYRGFFSDDITNVLDEKCSNSHKTFFFKNDKKQWWKLIPKKVYEESKIKIEIEEK